MQGWIDLIARLIAALIVIGIPCIIVLKIKDLIENIRIKYRCKRQWGNENSNKIPTNYQTKKEFTYNQYSSSYEPKYLMTLNEKTQFRKILHWAQSKGLLIFTKVRLLDLITPRKDQNNRQGLLWKIQAKHVDFVICDTDIKVKCIIEINDNSHKQRDRIERDNFVNEVLEACGYKILWTHNITDEQLNQICGYNIFTTEEHNQP